MEDRKLIIDGAGEYGKRLYHFFKFAGGKVDYFCQTDCNNTESCYDGINIIDIQELSGIKGTLIVYIAVCDDETSTFIKEQLLHLNRSDIYLYEMGEFIHKNIISLKEEKKPCYCNICGKRVDGFGEALWPGKELFEKYHVIGGGGVRKNIYCPVCNSTERRRWQYWVLGKHTNIFKNKCSVLHIAPEPEISSKIKRNALCDYYTGNIVPGAMHIVDVTDIQFRDNYFDYIIMNHVLEHVEDQKKAIFELKRVLKPDGEMILSFPICTDMDTYENPNVKTSEERLKEYGQEDHVRLYGRDYRTVLEKYGLKIKKIYSPQDECSDKEISEYAFAADDIILVCGIG